MTLADHLLLLPIVVPLLTAAALLLIDAKRRSFKFAFNLGSMGLSLVFALCIFQQSQANADLLIYTTANWPAPFGIMLWADSLAALMLMLTAVIAICSLIYSWSKWIRVGIHFHALLQFLLMGINGILLTADLFNLFVFFEVMLAASYGLLLHAYNNARIRAGLQYLAVNLLGSCFFLIGIALIYAATGSLHMADIAHQVAGLEGHYAQFFKLGSAMLAVAFLTKGGIWPLCFWLPATYSASSAPVASLIALMTKVGIYIILRLWVLNFSEQAGDLAFWGSEFLFFAGLISLVFAAIGLFASQEPMRMASYSAIVSSGLLLCCISYGNAALISAALFYLISSALALSALILLLEIISNLRSPAASILALTMEAFAIKDSETDERKESYGLIIPAAMALLGLAFLACVLVLTGLPPLSGFIAKLSIFHYLLQIDSHFPSLWTASFFVLIIISGFFGILAFMRFGVRTFWAVENRSITLAANEIAPAFALLFFCLALTISAGWVLQLFDAMSQQLLNTAWTIQQVIKQ